MQWRLFKEIFVTLLILRILISKFEKTHYNKDSIPKFFFNFAV